MAGWLTNILSGGAKGLIDGVKDVADTFIQTADEKAAFNIKVEELITLRLAQVEESVRARLTATMEIIKAEMASGDNFTRRARPSVVYFGLLLIMWNYAVRPMFSAVGADGAAASLPPIELPEEFWWGWSSVVGIWSLGRTAERVGLKGVATTMVVGKSERVSKMERLLE